MAMPLKPPSSASLMMYAGVAGGRVGEEVPRAVLEALVVGQEQRGAVAEPVLVQDPVQPGFLARAQACLLKS